MTDPLERAKVLLDEAARERDTARNRVQQLDVENHQLRRRFERAQEQYDRLDRSHAELEQRLHEAEHRAEMSRRATLDHAART